MNKKLFVSIFFILVMSLGVLGFSQECNTIDSIDADVFSGGEFGISFTYVTPEGYNVSEIQFYYPDQDTLIKNVTGINDITYSDTVTIELEDQEVSYVSYNASLYNATNASLTTSECEQIEVLNRSTNGTFMFGIIVLLVASVGIFAALFMFKQSINEKSNKNLIFLVFKMGLLVTFGFFALKVMLDIFLG